VEALPLDAAEKAFRGRFGRPYIWADRCASTQQLLGDAPDGAVAATNEQTKGRGRLGRSWDAPPQKALLFSIVLVPPLAAERLPELTLVAGRAVAHAIAAETGLRADVKDPNDVLISGRKVAGILGEASDGRVVLGIGINVAQGEAELPQRTRFPATSLALEGAAVDRTRLLATVLETLERRYDEWLSASG
jgi:BirA family biotin operon repressor/biotin-[acetyl-CoA-carboxylase] ligase